MFVSGFPSPSFLRATTANSFIFFPPTLKYNSSLAQAKLSSFQLFPTFSIHLSNLTIPPVFALQSGSWRDLSGHRREGKSGRVGGALRSEEKNACGTARAFGFSMAECGNPDVWASFIRKTTVPNGHAPTHRRWMGGGCPSWSRTTLQTHDYVWSSGEISAQ